MKIPRIKTTVVGSYPLPDWLAAAPSEQALEDAMRVVLHTQEQAGIDLVCDGELYRFDLNHPETNGMIEYFTRPMSGIRSDIGFSEWLAYSKGAGMRFRTRPPGVVEGPGLRFVILDSLDRVNGTPGKLGAPQLECSFFSCTISVSIWKGRRLACR